jgi:hypothetical protein
MKKSLVTVFLCIAGIFVIVSLACASSTPTGEPKISTATPEAQEQPAVVAETDQPAAKPTNTEVPTTAPTDVPEPVYLGDAVENSGYVLSAVTVEDPATPGMFYQPESGKKLVAVEIVLGVAPDADPISANPLNGVLVDSEGFTYQTELGGVDDQLATTELFPGEKLRGWVAFSIPEGSSPSSIKYSIGTFGGETIKAGLEVPPDGRPAENEALSFSPSQLGSKLGDAFEQFGYSLTALTVENPTKPGILYEPREGYKLVGIEITFGNVSGEVFSVNPLDTRLVDTNGYVYAPELGGRDEQLATTEINAGEKVRGWVAFNIPEDATPYIIKYQAEVFSFNYLQTGLEE